MLKSLPQNTRSEFFAALEGVKQEVESAAKVTATKSHNASAIIFASISEAVEEKLDALNETLGAILTYKTSAKFSYFYLRRSHAGQWMINLLRVIYLMEAFGSQRDMGT